MLDQQQHDYYLKRILRDIINDPSLSTKLALKGGTCLYLFYNLPRFSVDLDFNMINDNPLDIEKVQVILGKYLNLEDGRFKAGENSWLWEASYEKGQRKFQIDINKRKFPDKYVTKQFYGLSLSTLAPDYLFAHKLCAITDRKRVQNRDLFDAWFMFEGMFDINKEIIQLRTKKTLKEYLQEVRIFVQKEVDQKHILQGIGELLDVKQRQWVKEKLINELLAHIDLKIH